MKILNLFLLTIAALFTSVTANAQNTPPVVQDVTVMGLVNTDIAFASAVTAQNDVYTDADGDAMTKLMITGLPSNGTLKLGAAPITLNQEIPTLQLLNIVYTPNPAYTGADNFTWNGHDGTEYAAADATTNITVRASNATPSDITISDATIDENSPFGSTVGSLTAIDADGAADFHVYELTAGAGDTDNGLFTVFNNKLQSNFSLDFETRTTYSVRVAASDALGQMTDKQFTLTVNDVNDVPVPSGFNVDAKINSTTHVNDYFFTSAYYDQEGHVLFQVRIETTPSNGDLTLNGFLVNAGDVISTATLDNLRYTPDPLYVGGDSFTWSAHDGSDWSTVIATTTFDVVDERTTSSSSSSSNISSNFNWARISNLVVSRSGTFNKIASDNDGLNITGIEKKAVYVDLNSFPNPFKENISIQYTLEDEYDVSIRIFNALGQEVTELISAKQVPGLHTINWNSNGADQGSYVYLVTLKDATGEIVNAQSGTIIKK